MKHSIKLPGCWAAAVISWASLCSGSSGGQTAGGFGQFEDHGDIGTVLHSGSVSFDADKGRYRITASGENMWGTADAFQFAWKKFSGDVSITADIAFPAKTGNPHKRLY